MWLFILLAVLVLLLSAYLLFKKITFVPEDAPPLVYYKGGNRYAAAKAVTVDCDEAFRWMVENYGDAFTIDFFFFKQIFLVGVDGAKFLYTSPESKLSFGHFVNRFLRGLFDNEGIKIRPEHEDLERNEKILKTITKLLPHSGDVIVEESRMCLDRLCDGKPFELYEMIDNLVMKLNIRCFLGDNGDTLDVKKFMELYDELERKGMEPMAVFFYWLPFGTPAKLVQIRKELSRLITQIVDHRLANPEEKHEDYMQAYIGSKHKHRDELWSKAEIVERVQSLFVAARINTTRTLYWTTLHIACMKDVQRKVREELEEYRDASLKKLIKLPYTEGVFRETVRRLASPWQAGRVAMCDLDFKDMRIPKGWYLCTMSNFVGRNEKYFEKPNEFWPERWEAIRNSDNPDKKWLYTFFGNGQHKCKGEILAQTQIKLFWKVLLSEYEIEWVDQKEDNELPEYPFPQHGQLPYPTKKAYVKLSRRE